MATVITNVTELQAMENDLTLDYELGNNIDASATSGWNGGDGFDPIGDNSTKFTGSFNGRGYTIDSLYIDRVSTNDCGLFGYIGDNVTLQNVSLINADIVGDLQTGVLVGHTGENCTISKCSSTGTHTYGDLYTGGLVGLLGSGSTISGSYSTCTVSGKGSVGGLIGAANTLSVVERCYATGAITHRSSFYPRAGGLVGFNYGTVRECYATGDVGGYDDNGGFVGRNDGTIENCYARGDVAGDDEVGGFCGYNNDTIDNSYSTGTPTGNTEVGGFCGSNNDTITDCFWDTLTSGIATSDGGTGKTTTQMKTQSTFTDVLWNFVNIWRIKSTWNDGYPHLRWFLFTIWTQDTRVYFISEFGTKKISGRDTGVDTTSLLLFVRGTYLHFIAADGNERRKRGFKRGATGQTPFDIWITGDKLRYIDANGDERYLPLTSIANSALLNEVIFNG